MTRYITSGNNQNIQIEPNGTGEVIVSKPLNALSLEFTSTAEIIGTDTNNNADAGSVGELISSTVPSGSAVAVTNVTATDITSIVLTPGDWDVWGLVQTLPAGTTTTQQIIGWTDTSSATLPSPPNEGAYAQLRISTGGGDTQGVGVGTRRYSVASNTTIYLSTLLTFSVSTMSAYGYLAARRRR